MINSYLGPAAGTYSYISNIGIILSVIWMSTNNAWVPWFYGEMSKNNEKKVKKVSNYYLVVFTLITMIVMVVSIDLAKFMAQRLLFWVIFSGSDNLRLFLSVFI